MSQNHPKAGPNFTPAYQVSGIPFVTSSAQQEVSGPDLNTQSDEPILVEFPFVTKYVTIRNTGRNELRVGFSKRGIFAPGERLPASLGGAAKGAVSSRDNRNYFIIPSASAANQASIGNNAAATTMTFDVRCTRLFFMSDAASNTPTPALSGSFSLFAGLTMIPAGQFPTLTGSVAGVQSFEGIG